jgi:hypothetical protein
MKYNSFSIGFVNFIKVEIIKIVYINKVQSKYYGRKIK